MLDLVLEVLFCLLALLVEKLIGEEAHGAEVAGEQGVDGCESVERGSDEMHAQIICGDSYIELKRTLL